MYYAKLTFNAANRKTEFDILPRVGEIISLNDNNEVLLLRVDLVVHTKEAGSWS